MKTALIIAGMHRSGTSMVARLLNLQGVALPEDLHGSDHNNQSGYWESRLVTEVNDQLLRLGESIWFDHRPYRVPGHAESAVLAHRQQIQRVADELVTFADPAVCIKDPRICRVLPYWREAFETAGCRVAVIIPYRNPLEVAASIMNRDGLGAEHCLKLWLRHVLDAERFSRDLPRAFCSYEEALADWPAVFRAICKQVPLEGITPPPDSGAQTGGFVNSGIKHWSYNQKDLDRYCGADALATQAYRLLQTAEQDDGSALHAAFDRLREEFERPVSLLGDLEAKGSELIMARSMLERRDAELADAQSRLGHAEGQLAQLHTRFDDAKLQKQQALEHVQAISAHARELDLAQQRLRASLSWKITWPLRFLMDGLVIKPIAVFQSLFKTGVKVPETDPHPLLAAELAERHPVPLTSDTPPGQLLVRLIAFYLPQFHPIAENDAWWSEGFTEWTKVRPAEPSFAGHDQPKRPGELGHYDLRDIAVQRRQVELARLHGVGGFCFYFYWFRGRRLLEAPILQYLENPDLDLPFCLCWANENWTRTWDGLESEVLIDQDHSVEDDLKFISYLSRYLADERYIRVNGKPLLVVYRPNLLPDPAATAMRWRDWCRDNGIGEIFLASTLSFERTDPRHYGFDAAIEFPPNNTAPDMVTDLSVTLRDDFKGVVYDWTSVAKRARRYDTPDYPTFRGVNPRWDNTARRGSKGAIFAGSTPGRYREWLRNAVLDTVARFHEPSERLVFVNAWNEWAEGAYLEPDQAYGYAWLQATREALEAAARDHQQPRMLLVAHDAHPHGAQYLALHMARTLTRDLGFQVDLVVLGGGPLLDEYRLWADVHCLAEQDPSGAAARDLAEHFATTGHRVAICNTIATGMFLELLAQAGLRCVALIHELTHVIEDGGFAPHARAIAQHAAQVVFPAQAVRDSFLQFAPGLPADRINLRHQGLYKRNRLLGRNAAARTELRRLLGLKARTRIVLGVGYLDHRKGVDLFVASGLQVCAHDEYTHFVWIGHWDIQMRSRVESMLEGHPLASRFIFPGRQPDTDLYYAGADVFALTSREDPFPSTVLEALEVALPVIGFQGAGGSELLLARDCGLLVPMGDVSLLAAAIRQLLEDRELADRLGRTGANIIRTEFSFRHYLYDLLELTGQPLPRVSVIVPNYNYAQHLRERLQSILDQDHPIFELLVLDDASTDDSLQVIENCLAGTEVDYQLLLNDSNSGSVFRQWRKGVEAATGDYIWICEADDFALSGFLRQVLRAFADPEVKLSYAQSRQVDESGHALAEDYLAYTDDVCPEKWRHDYVESGLSELSGALAVKNTIPNVSAVVFRREDLLDTLQRQAGTLDQLKVAGDWLVYSDLLRKGRCAYTAKPLNCHRRHAESVTISTDNNRRHMAEVMFMQRLIDDVVELDDETREKAHKFARHVVTHLQLDPATLEELVTENGLDVAAARERF